MLDSSQLLSVFRPHSPASYRRMVGFEYEVPCFDRATLRPLPYAGSRGLGAVLQAAADIVGSRVEGDPPNKVPLSDGGLLSIEPGGQFEFSSAPSELFRGCLKQLREFLDLLRTLRERFDLQTFFGGVDPVHTVEEIGLIATTPRYRIMDAYFPRVGSMGRRMMRQTSSLQVTFDYDTPELGAELLRTAFRVAPLAAALFAHSPFLDGKPTGYRTYRPVIWAHTDPARTGLVPGFLREDFGFADYVAHVVRAPMFFVRRPDGALVDAQGLTFAEFNERGFEGQQATLDDFRLHNSTIFTDVRLKETVEVRSVDCQDPVLVPPLLAFLSGLLLCAEARERTRQTLGWLGPDDYAILPLELAREGISGTHRGRPVRELMLELIETARHGLATCFSDGDEAARSLERLTGLCVAGRTPADVVIEQHGDDALAWLKAGRTF